MIKKEDIIAKMNAGASIDDIAAEITDILNEATDEFIASRAEKEKCSKKEAIARQFNDLVVQYVAIECPELADEIALDATDIDAIMSAMDQLIGIMKMAQTFKELLPEKTELKPAAPKAKADAPKSDDEILNDFISKLLA